MSSKQFISVGLVDAIDPNSNANSFTVNFNNNALTNIQGQDTKTTFKPVLLTLDWDYNNITEVARNNTIQVSGTAIYNSPVKVIVPDGTYTTQSLINEIVYQFNQNVKWNNGGVPLAMSWIGGVDSGRIYLCWTATNPAGVNGGTTINTYPIFSGTQYNMTKPLGYTKSSPNIVQTSIVIATAGVPNNIQPVLSPNTSDVRTYDTIRVCSNLAKRHFEKVNGVLSQTQVLMEIAVYGISIGQTLIWEALTDIYSQTIVSNFDNMTIEIRDTNGNLIPLKNSCDLNMMFVIERDLPSQSAEERVASLRNINRITSI